MSEFWNNKKVFVTGAGGFIGSHLVEKLVQEGANVRAFVRYNSRQDPGLLKDLKPDVLREIEIVYGELRDSDCLIKHTRSMQVIFHLGAIISIPYSYLHPKDTIETNILGTTNILLAALANNCEKLIHTSSSEVYGSAQYVPIDENHPLQGQSPYSASKIGADKIVESFYCAYNAPVVTIRPFNTYGPRQSQRAVIPTIISQILEKEQIKLGTLATTRDFTYISDTVNGFLQAGITSNIFGETINLGTGTEISIGDLTQKIASLIGKEVSIDTDEDRLRPSKSEVKRLLSNNFCAKEKIHWEPSVSMDEGLMLTIQWIKNHIRQYDVNTYVV